MDKYDRRTFYRLNGGVMSSDGAKLYFYIIAQNIQNTKLKRGCITELLQDYVRLAAETNEEFAFITMDISITDELKNQLYKSNDGVVLWNNIVNNLPDLVISKSYLADLRHVRSVDVICIENPQESMTKILTKVNAIDKRTSGRLRNFLVHAINSLELKPNIAGFGFNLNEILLRMIKK